MVNLEIWLYGPLAGYAGNESRGSHARLLRTVPQGTRMVDLLARLGIPLEEKGITFVNAQLTDMPGMAADLEMKLRDGDRIGIFHRRSMWPFQYRFGASLSDRLREAIRRREEGALCHSPQAGRDT